MCLGRVLSGVAGATSSVWSTPMSVIASGSAVGAVAINSLSVGNSPGQIIVSLGVVPPNATSTEIQFATNSTFTANQTTTTAASRTHTQTGLLNGRFYYVRVRALGGAARGDGPWSAAMTITTLQRFFEGDQFATPTATLVQVENSTNFTLRRTTSQTCLLYTSPSPRD